MQVLVRAMLLVDIVFTLRDPSTVLRVVKIGGVWLARDMASLDRPDRRERLKLEREATSVTGRLRRAAHYTQEIAEVRDQYRPLLTDIGNRRDQSFFRRKVVRQFLMLSVLEMTVLTQRSCVCLSPWTSAIDTHFPHASTYKP